MKKYRIVLQSNELYRVDKRFKFLGIPLFWDKYILGTTFSTKEDAMQWIEEDNRAPIHPLDIKKEYVSFKNGKLEVCPQKETKFTTGKIFYLAMALTVFAVCLTAGFEQTGAFTKTADFIVVGIWLAVFIGEIINTKN